VGTTSTVLVAAILAISCNATSRLNEHPVGGDDSYSALIADARDLFANEKFEQSLQVLARCIAIRQNDPEAFKLVALNSIRLDKLSTAEDALKRAARLAPDDYLVHFNLGALYYTESRFLDAQPELERAVALKADHAPGLIFLGLTCEELGQDEAAIKMYRKAIALGESQNAKNELPYLYLGRLFYRLDRFEDATPLLRQSVLMKPASGEGWLLLGKTLRVLGHLDESITALERAAAVDGGSPEPHYLLSRVYLAQHRDQDARTEMARFEALRVSEPQKNDGRRKRR
jgi:tetratricopeptide (TPR) repeat protein